ncbi:hypothetical protein SDC9_153487 [bioreactor metagenome]|uniref:Uncharacterized protein n=1 Tax=bioreactor metagenome TaxID=1076179 RepID=A0A645EW20_9ZZZZ
MFKPCQWRIIGDVVVKQLRVLQILEGRKRGDIGDQVAGQDDDAQLGQVI